MSSIVCRFPVSDADDPLVWRVIHDVWHSSGVLSKYRPDADDTMTMALVSPADARCIWSSFPDLEPRQAEGVAKLRAAAQSLGAVHAVARHIIDDIVITATISPDAMEYGLVRLALNGLNPDIVIPAGLVIDPHSDNVVRAEFDGVAVLRGREFAIPDEPALRDLLIGDGLVENARTESVQQMLVTASECPVLNLREGLFAKRERIVWATSNERKWIIRLLVGLVLATSLLGLLTLAKYWTATYAEDNRALAAAQTIDPAIQDVMQAEVQLDRSLQQKGIAKGRFTPLSAGLWRAVKAAPNVSVRELRYADGILSVILAAPDSNGINKALVAIQQDGYRVTATPRQDTSGATLVDLTMRMP